ncbi:hypothetical protein FOZ62_005950, partial [Perkinsus olseni]
MPGYGTLSQWEYYSEERSGSASSEVLLASFAAAAGGSTNITQQCSEASPVRSGCGWSLPECGILPKTPLGASERITAHPSVNLFIPRSKVGFRGSMSETETDVKEIPRRKSTLN